jgi:drug/metabolite transporter (DMT)-like permease
VTVGYAVAIALLVVLWAAAFPLIKVGLEELSPPHLTLLRHLVASGAFVVFLVALRQRLLPALRDWPALIGLGLLGIFVYHLALNTREQRVSAGATSLIIATAPLLTVLVATALGRDRLSSLGWVGSLLGLAGVTLIVLGDGGGAGSASGTSALDGSSALALDGSSALALDPYALWILLAAFVTALFAVLQGPLLVRYRPLELMAYVTWGGTLPMLAFLGGLGDAVVAGWPRSTGAAVLLGIFPSAIAYTLFAVALSRGSAVLATSYLYLIPVVALLLSWWWLGEVPTPLTVVGGAVVIVALLLMREGRRRLASMPAPRPVGD